MIVIRLKVVIILLIVIIVASLLLVTINLKKKTEDTIEVSNSVSKYEIFVDVEESKLYLFENGNLSKTYKCSGGKWSTPSPIGTWTIIEKAKWGEGFGGSWLRT